MVLKRGVFAVMMSVALCGATFVGCGGVPETKVTVPSSGIEASVRATLEEYAKTGKTGSSLTSLESDINGIGATDSAKASKLKAAYMELQQVSNEPDKVKAKAQEMLGML
jgi:hypothetical protein